MKVNLNPANYDPEKWAAIERLKYLQLVEGLTMNVETLKVDPEGRILLDPDDSLHKEWFEND
ncbi:hypothetical protein A0126_19035 (plasmid) [Exiguobacterium sp. N4-1P]|uniref:hypothetical protein n=1 Tax=Exiguobacterium sp. N4-1P TaxID=2051906 RepID=UPI000B58BEBC|nr:hypothetical protein [Exiguobacterium sp. N4-1P]ASI34042.1 hypothetical protein A0126_00025 [Exiguobacterium sp. N4-1P]ASI37684.1 hypothetical protein A0126_19035 [Exiguobacterium sp. N4-1P]